MGKKLIVKNADFSENRIPLFNITTTVVNGEYSGSSTITPTSTAKINVTANNGYLLPTTISVTNASYTLALTGVRSGEIILSDATDDVVVSVECVAGDPIDVASTATTTESNVIQASSCNLTTSAVFDLKTINLTEYAGRTLIFSGYKYNAASGAACPYAYGLFTADTPSTDAKIEEYFTKPVIAASGWKKKGIEKTEIWTLPVSGNIYLITEFFKESMHTTAADAPTGTMVYDGNNFSAYIL